MRNAKLYKSLPYNPELRAQARKLRQAGVLSEVLVWQQLHKGKFKGYDFDRQKIIGNYIVDFYCGNCDVVIEIDGNTHDCTAEHEIQRDIFLKSLGLTVIHILAEDVLNNMRQVMEILRSHPALQGEE